MFTHKQPLLSTSSLAGFTPQLCSSQHCAPSSQEVPAVSSTPPDEGSDSLQSSSGSCSCSSEDKSSDNTKSTSASRSVSSASQDSEGSSAVRSASEFSGSDAYYDSWAPDTEDQTMDTIELDDDVPSPVDDDFSVALKRKLRALLALGGGNVKQIPNASTHPQDMTVRFNAHVPRLVQSNPAPQVPPRYSRSASISENTDRRYLRYDFGAYSAQPAPMTNTHLPQQQCCDGTQAHIPSLASAKTVSDDTSALSHHPAAPETIPVKRSRSTGDEFFDPVPAKRSKADICAIEDCNAKLHDGDKENNLPIQDAAGPLRNAVARRRSRLSTSSSLRHLTSTQTTSQRQASTLNVPFAEFPASLRKAGSLRSEGDLRRVAKEEEEDELVPTEPNMPIPVLSPSVLRSPTPDARSPSTSGSARARLQRLCERARSFHARVCDEDGGEAVTHEDAFVIGPDMRLNIISWLLTFLPSKRAHPHLYDQLSTSPETRFHAVVLLLTCLKQTVEEGNWADFVNSKIRASLVEDAAGHESSAQLARGAERTLDEDLAEYEAEELVDGLRLIVWDAAIGALALSVKFHRDNLPPLLPIYADEFTAIAPHDVDYQTFEECQRDVLRSVHYMFGVTPQPLMDNMWLAVPELQSVLDYESGQEQTECGKGQERGEQQSELSKASMVGKRSGRAEVAIWRRWNCVRRRAWEVLFRSCREPDVMRFDTAVLTAAAVVHALLGVCAMEEELVDPRWNLLDARRAGLPKEGAQQSRWVRRARRRVAREDLEDGICAAMGLSVESLSDCKNWLADMLSV